MMPPRRTKGIFNDVYKRIMARIKERLDQFVDQFANGMNDSIRMKFKNFRKLPYSNTFVDEMLPSDAFEEISAVSADEDAVEELQDINITEGTLTDKLPPPDTLDVKLTDDAIEGALQDISFNDSALIDEFAPSNPLGVELTSDEAEETMEDSGTKAEDQFKEEQLQKVSTSNNDEDDIPTMIPVLGIERNDPLRKRTNGENFENFGDYESTETVNV
ncbi:hypothetical protein Tco_0257508 [Tanacetum coccineum]